MSPPDQRSLLDRRLLIVTGKGGTGKSSVVAALALCGARAGRRVMVVETGRDEAVSRLLAPGSPEVGYQGRSLQPNLSVMRIEPYEALAEYIGLQFGGRGLAQRVFQSSAFRQLMDASPGWRELITLGKIWHLGQLKDERDTLRHDLIVVDAPATGHGITFLDVPRVVISAVRAGPLRRHSGWVEEMIEDRENTLLVPVALAEELPARETVELVERLRNDVNVAVDRVLVNAVSPAPFPTGLEDLDEHLGRLPRDLKLPGLPTPAVLTACAQHLRSRYELNRFYVEEIRKHTQLPIHELPYVPEGIHGPTGLEALATALEPTSEAA